MIGGIYKIQNVVNGKCYIGSAKSFKTRFRKHKNVLVKNAHHSIKLQRSWNKHGEDAFVFQPIIICKPKDLLFYEQQAIDAYNSYYKGYNATIRASSAIGVKRSDETKNKISVAKKGIKLSDQHKQSISDGNKGRIHSDETKEKLRLAHTGIKKTQPHVEKMRQANLGKKYSNETKAKVSASLIGNKRALGNVLSAETKEKMSIAHKGKAQSPEWVEKRIAKRLATIAAKKLQIKEELS
jgi:group I intron endonuclease